MAERRQKGRTFDGAVKITRKKRVSAWNRKSIAQEHVKEEKWNLNSAHAMHWCLKKQSNQTRYMFCKIYWTLRNSIASKLIGIILYSRQWLHTIDIFNSYYLNNKVTCEKFDILLYATFRRPLDVQISFLSTRLQWSEKGRSMDVQYGTWTDGPNKDVQFT